MENGVEMAFKTPWFIVADLKLNSKRKIFKKIVVFFWESSLRLTNGLISLERAYLVPYTGISDDLRSLLKTLTRKDR